MKYFEPFVTALVENVSSKEVPDKLDIVLEGGAMNGAYHAGALCYLQALQSAGKTNISRLSGVSCGALAAAVYLGKDLDSLEESYKRLQNCLLSYGNFSVLRECIDDFVSTITDERLKGLNGRLFISYVDLKTQKRVVVSEYPTREILAESLQKTAHLPAFIDGTVTTKDKCIDGGVPYIFPNDDDKRGLDNYKTLYLRLTTFNMIKDAISTKGEDNVARRAVEGIQRTHDLFKQGRSNEYASLVENWSRQELMKYSLLSFAWWLVSYVIYILTWIYEDVLPISVKEHTVVRRLTNGFAELWGDYLCRFIT